MYRTLAALVLLVPSLAAAQSRPDARRLTCAQAQSVVRSNGAVVLSTGTYTYERFVTGSGLCALGQTTQPAWTATGDQPQCFIGYTCVERAQRSGQ